MEDKLQTLSKIYGDYICFDSSETTVTNYTKLAEEYEKDFVGLGYDTPHVLARTAVKHLPTNSPQTRVLDVACGTGLVGDGMVAHGYRGKLVGVDGSAGMLKVARDKKTYESLVETFIYKDTRLGESDGCYDGVVCCGGFGPGHLDPAVLRELLRVTKRRGAVVFATRYNEHATAYVEELRKVMEELAEGGFWEEEEKYEANYFDVDFCDNSKPLLATIYCYRKL